MLVLKLVVETVGLNFHESDISRELVMLAFIF